MTAPHFITERVFAFPLRDGRQRSLQLLNKFDLQISADPPASARYFKVEHPTKSLEIFKTISHVLGETKRKGKLATGRMNIRTSKLGAYLTLHFDAGMQLLLNLHFRRRRIK